MTIYTKQSLERLREKIDLIELVSSHVQLKPSGSVYKGLCPFHEEKNPSFMIQRGESYYHCFGCGAHGDGIAFLMNYLKLNFIEAVDILSEKFQVPLQTTQLVTERKELNKRALKEVLQKGADFYHMLLLHTEEGQQALRFLYNRGIDLEFIRLFNIGWAPKKESVLKNWMTKHRFSLDLLQKVGLIKEGTDGKKRPFFVGRITFPILDNIGNVIGFSARKIEEEMFGPKYLNTPETPLFKKSQILYGLSFCRKRIAKEKRAIIVEGQIDALRLIQEGMTLTVAGQGTAFTKDQVKELLQLGITKVYLALDGDQAGETATIRLGNFFQKEGVEACVVPIPLGMDPDTFLNESGPLAFIDLLQDSVDYLSFLLNHFSKGVDFSSPSQKNHCIQTLVQRIRSWNHPLMVHESLRKLARLTQVPEKFIGIDQEGSYRRSVYVKRSGSLSEVQVNPDRILETDLLRWLYLVGSASPQLLEIIQTNLRPEHFTVPICRRLFSNYIHAISQKEAVSLLSLANDLDNPEEKLLFSEIVQKKVNPEKAEEGVMETVTQILYRRWMEERERIKREIQSGRLSEAEILALAKQFDHLKRSPPVIHTRAH